jgi:predicted RNase H-like HicB family nuclease
MLHFTTFMTLRFQMEYWKDGSWLVGRLPQVPGVFSQGATLGELEENIRDAYRMMLEEQDSPPGERFVETKEIEVPV